MSARTTHPVDDGDATVDELHQRAAEDYSANRPYREDHARQQGGGQQ
jgi:hypothetical protein